MDAVLAELLEFVVWIDHRIVELTLAVRTPLLTEAMTSVTGLGSATAALVFLGICYLAGWTDELRSATLALALAGVVVGTMMWTIQRPFPPGPVCVTGGAETVTSSLPSGHAAAGAIYAMTARRSSVLPFGAVAVLAVAIAVSRIYLGTHYFSDTLVGVGIGVGTFALAVWLHERLDLDAVVAQYRSRQ
ncbi:phosphatase PAP2 family protein [Halalkalicoccus sp. NIPERK01]|uniref:phosphatase PAP2 family protein n=1 Tax=Halalkalicoccus sp. NIPERK01 TaxID=3053469 RepID=UPI00256F4DDA|nr:phosphatase PAP2 family protein [Halalkalicoccus sp. NIPERK01]MDL5363338.1 phosphatase PAP2 family protein [Halalkalicoccus sp. NIPERK01]